MRLRFNNFNSIIHKDSYNEKGYDIEISYPNKLLGYDMSKITIKSVKIYGYILDISYYIYTGIIVIHGSNLENKLTMSILNKYEEETISSLNKFFKDTFNLNLNIIKRDNWFETEISFKEVCYSLPKEFKLRKLYKNYNFVFKFQQTLYNKIVM